MKNSLTLFINPLLGLYILTFALRLGMQWVRADFRNPIVQFVLKVTNPLVMPFRSFLPPVYKIDTATALVYLLLCWGAISLLTTLECTLMPDLLTLFGLGLLYGIRLLLNTYSIVILGFVLMSWIGQGGHNPSVMMLANVLGALAKPVLTPVQRVLPSIAGLDLSPVLLLITLQACAQMLFAPAYRMTADYNCALMGIL